MFKYHIMCSLINVVISNEAITELAKVWRNEESVRTGMRSLYMLVSKFILRRFGVMRNLLDFYCIIVIKTGVKKSLN
jgi:hypothetical protein